MDPLTNDTLVEAVMENTRRVRKRYVEDIVAQALAWIVNAKETGQEIDLEAGDHMRLVDVEVV